MNRTQTVLTVLLGLQLLLILIVRSPFSSATAPMEAQPLLASLQDTEIAASRIELSGREDKSLTLVRDGEAWSIEDFDGFPADASKVDELLDNLGELTVRRPVVTSGRHHRSFKVAGDEWSFDVIAYFTEPAAINKVIMGGLGGGDEEPEQPEDGK